MKHSQSVVGEYQIAETLDRSQYSVLCLGKKSATGQLVLLKLWLTAQVDSEEKHKRVREEVAALQNIEHPHLLPVLEVLVDAQEVCLVYEYAPLARLMSDWARKGRRLFPLKRRYRLSSKQVGPCRNCMRMTSRMAISPPRRSFSASLGR